MTNKYTRIVHTLIYFYECIYFEYVHILLVYILYYAVCAVRMSVYVHMCESSHRAVIKSFQGKPVQYMNGRMHEWVTVLAQTNRCNIHTYTQAQLNVPAYLYG